MVPGEPQGLARRTGLLLLAVFVLVGAGRPALACVIDADCFDLNPCFINKRCVAGVCQQDPVNCDDGDPCTVDGCNSAGAGCTHTPFCPDQDSLVCNAGQRCLIAFVLGHQVAECVPTGPPSCDDHDACTADSCVEPTGCQHSPISCDDGNACTTDSCDPASGCAHAHIAGCCQTAADCPHDACTIRPCTAGTCGAPAAIVCDDGNPATVDGCDPATGCTHTPVAGSTTTTMPPTGGSCSADADCPAPADPCLLAACEPGGQCGSRALTGFDGLACICRRPLPAACNGAELPGAVVRARAKACKLIARAAGGGPKASRLLGRVAHVLAGAEHRLAHAKHLDAACASADGALFADGASRATSLRNQPRGLP